MVESSVAMCSTYVFAPAGMFHSPKPWHVICVHVGLYSSSVWSHCSQPSEIMMSAFVTSCMSFGDGSKCAGHAPGGIMYETVMFSGRRFFVKSASIELVQTMFMLLSSAFTRLRPMVICVAVNMQMIKVVVFFIKLTFSSIFFNFVLPNIVGF